MKKMKCTKTVLFSLLLAFIFTGSVIANESKMWPGVNYDQSIPTFSQVLGYEVGERITSHADMLIYFEVLAKASPKQIQVHEYARSWENRELIYVVIGSESNIAQLSQFESHMNQLSQPGSTDSKAIKTLIKSTPGSVWLAYGVHGNEISSTDAAMMTAYHLLAAQNNEITDKILSNTLVFIDPLQNPDGRNRFVNHYYGTVGLLDNGDRLNAEHDEPWPSGRFNHYLFDMNRDWLALTQPETQGRVKILNKYHPLVVIDLHEMGGDSGYYFAPQAEPVNPDITQTQLETIAKVGVNNGKHFDEFGFDYFTREVFDSFYPGYGDSWPIFYGAAASTYEVGSSRGIVFRKNTGVKLTYKETIQKHFVSSISTAEVVAENKDDFLNNYYKYQVSAIEKGKKSKDRYFILPSTKDQAGSHRLAQLLSEHGVEVQQAEQDFSACGSRYQKGAYIVDTAQPRGRFVNTVMTKQVDMDPKFLKEQESRRSDKLDNEIYDVTAWSLPLMYNVETQTCAKEINTNRTLVKIEDELVGQVNNPNAKVAYLVAWGDMAAGRFLTAGLRAGLIIKSTDKSFTLENKKTYPAGTLIIEVKNNKDNISEVIGDLSKQTGAIVDGLDSSWVTKGPSFGSWNVTTLSAINIAIAWDDPVNPLSAGSTRFVIEQQLNYPVTAIRTRTLKNADLNFYQVLILPSGEYKSQLDKKSIENLSNWVKQGGVLLTLGSATGFAAEVGLLDVKREFAYKEEDKDKKTNKKDKESKESAVAAKLISNKQELLSEIESAEQAPDSVPGVLVNIAVDQNHWLTAGINPNVIGMVTGNQIFTPIKLSSGNNVAWYQEEEKLLASGYLWEQNKQQMPFKPYLIQQASSKGMVIAFTQEPTFRAYLDGLNVLFMNAIFRSASHSSKVIY